METTVEKLSEDIGKIREAQEELRKELNTLHDDELIRLHEQLSTLRVRFRQATAVVGGIAIVGGYFGFTKWSDICSKIDDRVNHEVVVKLEESIRFGERFRHALYVLDSNDKSARRSALNMLKELAYLQSKNELPFSYLMECYIMLDQCREAYRQLKRLEEKGLRSDELSTSMGLRNYGFILWVNSLNKGPNTQDCDRGIGFLEDSLRKAQEDNQKHEIRAAAEYLVLAHLHRNDVDNAKMCVKEYLRCDIRPNWKKFENLHWFAELERKNPKIREVLANIMSPGATKKVAVVHSK